jgi:hypothetical protein
MPQTAQHSDKLDFDKVWLMFQDTDRRMKETDRQMKETDRQMKETDRQMKETDKKIKQLERLFTGQWGKLIESLVEGDLLNLLNKRNINVNLLSTRVRGIYEGRQFEFDIIAENGEEIVVVEVKTTLKPADVKDFIKDLKLFKKMRPKYHDNKIIGAVAYLTDEGDSSRMAQNKGLFAIRATGSSSSIVNLDDFEPRYW